ncbi:MAG: acetate--CoA ligase family protein, partial [Burkholderiales bacterium]
VRSGSGPDVDVWATRMIEISKNTDKPIAINWASVPGRDAAVMQKLEQAGFLCAIYARRAARAVGIFTEFALKRLRFDQATAAASARPLPRHPLDIGGMKGALSEHASKQCLSQYGIPSTKEVLLSPAEVMALRECPVSFPVAVKLASPDIPHKTEANAVRLGVNSLEELKHAAQSVQESGLRHTPNARIEGISIQQMASGIEVILGAVNDKNFGPYVMVGLGGVLTEVLRDVTHRFAPLTSDDAHGMLGELKGAKILEGYRGAPPADVDALVMAIVNLSWMISDHRSRIDEIDVNPLLVRARGQGVVAADALIVIGDSDR